MGKIAAIYHLLVHRVEMLLVGRDLSQIWSASDADICMTPHMAATHGDDIVAISV